MSSQPRLAARTKKVRLNRAEQKAERTQELLDAAWTLFCEKGYENLTIEDVAEHAGYSRMPIYSLFGDKQNLFFELWRRVVGLISQKLIGSLKPGAALRRNLKLLAEAVTQSNPDQSGESPAPERLFFVVQTIALSRPDIAAKLEKLARKVVEDMAEMVRQSTLGPGEALRTSPDAIAAHLVAHINGLATVQFQTHSRYAQTRDLVVIFEAIALAPSRP